MLFRSDVSKVNNGSLLFIPLASHHTTVRFFKMADNSLDCYVSKDLNFIDVRPVAARTYFNSFNDVLFSTARKAYCLGLLC